MSPVTLRHLKSGGFYKTTKMRWIRDEPCGKAYAPQGHTCHVTVVSCADRWRAESRGRTGWGATPEDAFCAWQAAMWNGWREAGAPPPGFVPDPLADSGYPNA